MAYSFLQGAEANRETPDSKLLFTSLRLTHFPQNPLLTDRFPPLSKSSKQSHSLSFRDGMPGSGTELGPSRAFHLFPCSGSPVGSSQSGGCHTTLSRQLRGTSQRGTRLGITRSEFQSWLLYLSAGSEPCLVLEKLTYANRGARKGMGI